MNRSSSPGTWEAFVRELGVNVHRARVDGNYTQERLAHAAGLTRTHVQQIERGMWRAGSPANPSVKALVRIANALGVELNDLLPQSSGVEFGE